MSLNKENNIDLLLDRMDGFSGAEIKAACTEAGYFAIRENRTDITRKDFLDAIAKVKKEEELNKEDYMHMFG